MEEQFPKPEVWVPPVITEPPEPEESVWDVLLMQYAVCILLLTVVLVLRLCDTAAYAAAAETFRSRTAAPSAAWAEQMLMLAQSLWS